MAFRLRNQSGFTLVELIVVMGIIGVLLASIGLLINPATQIARARDGERKTDIVRIRSGLEQFYADSGSYPSTIYTAPCPTSNSLTSLSGAAKYLDVVPCDPAKLAYNNGQYVSMVDPISLVLV